MACSIGGFAASCSLSATAMHHRPQGIGVAKAWMLQALKHALASWPTREAFSMVLVGKDCWIDSDVGK